jgi:hypothetical protein
MQLVTTRSYAFAIDTKPWAGCPSVAARILVRDGNAASPINPRSEGEDSLWDAPKRTDGLLLNNLVIRTWLSGPTHIPGRAMLIGPAVEFESLSYVNLKIASRAHATLRRINKQLIRYRIGEAGDMLMVIGRVLGVTMNVTALDPDNRGTLYTDNTWHWGAITEARDLYRAEVAKLQAVIDSLNKEEVA